MTIHRLKPQDRLILPNCLFSSVFLVIVIEKDNAEFSSNSKGPILII